MTTVLARYVVRTVQWHAVPVGLAAGLAFVIGARVASGTWTMPSLVFAMTAIAAGLAFTLDDPAGETVAGVPTPLWVRAVRAAAVAVGVAAVSWTVLLVVVRDVVPVRDITVMAAAVWAVALAVAGGARRLLGPVGGGMVAAPAVAILALGSSMVPDPWALSPGHAGMTWRWSAIAALALALLAWNLRDPARRGR